MNQSIDTLRGLRYKLRIMGIFIAGPSHIHGDNISVVHYTSKPGSVFRKKNNLACYHTVHESIAMGKFLVAHLPSSENVAKLMTKVIYGQRQKYLLTNILYDIHDDHHAPVIHSLGLSSGKFNPIGNSLNLEGTRKMQP